MHRINVAHDGQVFGGGQIPRVAVGQGKASQSRGFDQ